MPSKAFLISSLKKPFCLLICGLFASSALALPLPSRQDTQASASDSSSKSTKKKHSKKSTASQGDTGSTAASQSSTPAAPANTATSAKTTAAASSRPASPPGNGMVWVNLDTHVYHKQGDRWYGKTKNGKYMTEADAVQAGYRPAQTGKQSK